MRACFCCKASAALCQTLPSVVPLQGPSLLAALCQETVDEGNRGEPACLQPASQPPATHCLPPATRQLTALAATTRWLLYPTRPDQLLIC